MDDLEKKKLYEELIELQNLIKKESSLKELCKSLFFIY